MNPVLLPNPILSKYLVNAYPYFMVLTKIITLTVSNILNNFPTISNFWSAAHSNYNWATPYKVNPPGILRVTASWINSIAFFFTSSGKVAENNKVYFLGAIFLWNYFTYFPNALSGFRVVSASSTINIITYENILAFVTTNLLNAPGVPIII